MSESALQEYTELIIERDRLSKEAQDYQVSYVKRFGELIEKSFSLKIECIRCKKMISRYIKIVNGGKGDDSKKVTLDYLRILVSEEMAGYDEQLKNIIEIRKLDDPVSDYEIAQIKKIYHKIAMRIHPDINPQLFGNEEVKKLWEDISLAYKGNNLERMKELEAVAAAVISKYCDDVVAVVIGNIDEKIAKVKEEIETIKSTEPYMYRFLLEDEEMCAEKEAQLKAEIDDYQRYLNDLNADLETLGIK